MVTCIVDGDVTTKPDENGVGAIVDATGTEGKAENKAIFTLKYLR